MQLDSNKHSMAREKQDNPMPIKKTIHKKHIPERDRFIPPRPSSYIEQELQQGLLAEVFNIPVTSSSNYLCHTLFGVSLSALKNSRVLGFTLPKSNPYIPIKRQFSALDNFRVLAAPNLVSDDYFNPLCWADLIYMGLGNETYSYDSITKKVTKINHADTAISALSYNRHLIQATVGASLTFIDAKTTQSYSVNNLGIFTKIIPDTSNGSYLIGYSPETIPCFQRTLSHYDLRSKCMSFNLVFSGEKFTGLAFDKKYTLAVGVGNTVELWDLRHMSEPRLSFNGHEMVSKAIDFSPSDSKKITTGGDIKDKKLLLWDVTSGAVLAHTETEGEIGGIHWINQHGFFSTNGVGNESVSCWSKDGDTLVKEQTSSEIMEQTLCSAQNPQDPSTIVTATSAENLRFWSVNVVKNKVKAEVVSSLEMPVIR